MAKQKKPAPTSEPGTTEPEPERQYVYAVYPRHRPRLYKAAIAKITPKQVRLYGWHLAFGGERLKRSECHFTPEAAIEEVRVRLQEAADSANRRLREFEEWAATNPEPILLTSKEGT